MRQVVNRAIFILLGILLLNVPIPCTAGTLIVSYQSDSQGKRLERIRFLLTDNEQHRSMYPKGNAYIDDPVCHMRMVVIENLPSGDYNLEFLIPNRDGVFEDVPLRHFSMGTDSIIKIDQIIKIRYATLHVVIQGVEENSSVYPKIILKDDQQQVQAESETGELHASYLVPGTYSLVFSSIPGYQAPGELTISLEPGEELGPLSSTYIHVE